MPVADRLKRFLRHRVVIAAGMIFLCGMIFVGVLLRPTGIHPPRDVKNTQPVFLLVHDFHSSLVLPAGDGRLVRYSYGDWRYYAEGFTGAFSATRALLWPTPSAFGRREIEGAATPEAIGAAFPVAIDEMLLIPVEAKRVEQLRARLDELHRSRPESRIDSFDTDLEFVPHPRPYTAFHNSNQIVGLWLEELDCRISGHALLARWQVRL